MNRRKKAVFLQKRYTADYFFVCMTSQNTNKKGLCISAKSFKKSGFSRIFCLFSAFDNFFDYPR